MRFLLVTGGLSYLGAHIVVEYMRSSHIPILLDNTKETNNNLRIIRSLTGFTPEVHRGNLLNDKMMKALFSRYNFDAVYHLATNNLDSQNTLSIINNNVNGTRRLLQYMQRFDVKNLIFASTNNIYNNGEVGLLDQSAVPLLPYYRSIHLAEEAVMEWGGVRGNNYSILRLFNSMGFKYDGAFIESSYECFGDSFYSLCNLMLNETIEPYFVHYPDLERDYVHISDLVRVLIGALLNVEKGKSGIYNVGRGIGVTPKDLSQIYQELTDIELIKTPMFDKGLGLTRLVSNGPLPFNTQAEFSVRDALEEAIKWYPERD